MTLSPQTLEDAHVRLEPLDERHREALRPLANDPEIWALTTLRGDGGHFDAWFDGQLDGAARGKSIGHAVWSRSANAWAGHTAFLMIEPVHQRVEIGWTWYAAPLRGGVTNPACKRLLLTRAFAAGAQRVELKTHHRNLRSQRAMEKLGAIREGVLRSHVRCWTGERRDSVFYSILPDAWPDIEAGLNARLGDTLASRA